MYMDYQQNEVVISEFYLVKTSRFTKRLSPREQKKIDFRKHGDNRCCFRNAYYDDNCTRHKTPKAWEGKGYTSVAKARYVEQRALRDGFDKYDSDYDVEAIEAAAKLISNKNEADAYRVYQSLKSYFKD